MEDIKKNDEELISQFMTKVGITKIPISITRLGKPNENNKRTMKIVMASSDEKDFIMGNLKHLKGSENFGKIQVTDDYTNGERDLIRHWVKEAEKKSAADDNKVYTEYEVIQKTGCAWCLSPGRSPLRPWSEMLVF